MSSLPPGVRWHDFDGKQSLATRGAPLPDQQTDAGWRRWDATRSKLAALVEREAKIPLHPDSTVLYLGAAAGTTVSHVADVSELVYAVEFAHRPMRQLLEVAENRRNLIPLLKDVRSPETYAHVVESDIDLLIQDVATRGQVDVALENARFLASGGKLVLFLKARSEDVTSPPGRVFEMALEELQTGYRIDHTERLDPIHADHLAVVGTPRDSI